MAASPAVRSFRRTAVIALAFALSLALGSPLRAQATPPPANGQSREQTWPAPSAEDWKRPCLIAFQRTWEDALAVAKESGKPILICVNMDGEIASEHYAGIRYRIPDAAKLYEPYVCVIASTYRHTPRDYDESGQRILCPRFGSVTCGEHIAIEPFLFEKFFEGQRVAPRHVAVEVDGTELHDVFYAWDVQSVLDQIATTIVKRPPPRPIVRGDRSLVERVTSRDQADRVAVESSWQKGDAKARQALLAAALADPAAAPVELLRLALHSFDQSLASQARDGLARSTAPEAVPLIAEALSGPIDAAQRTALVGALDRLGASSSRARTLSVVHQGLATATTLIDLAAWTLPPDPAAVAARAQLWQQRLTDQDALLVGRDATALLELGEAMVDLATRTEDDRFAKLVLADAQRTVRRAAELGAHGHRVETTLAVTARELGDETDARQHAVAAIVAGAPDDPSRPEALAVLELFARSREQALGEALRQKTPWPPAWLAELNAAYSAMARHPLGRDDLIAGHYDVLQWLGAKQPAQNFLRQGLARFPDSDLLHARLRARALDERGPAGIVATYREWLAREEPSAALNSFAGYGAMVAAEFERRAGDAEAALASYTQAIEWYEAAIARLPDERGAADHFIALAMAGRARIAFERDDDATAVTELIACFTRAPASAATLDGLNLSPVDTAKMVLARLQQRGPAESAQLLDVALKALDPKLLELPEYERRVPRRDGR